MNRFDWLATACLVQSALAAMNLAAAFGVKMGTLSNRQRLILVSSLYLACALGFFCFFRGLAKQDHDKQAEQHQTIRKVSVHTPQEKLLVVENRQR